MHEQSEGSEELTTCDTVTDALGLRLEEVQDLSVENRDAVYTSQNRKNEIISSVRDSTLEARKQPTDWHVPCRYCRCSRPRNDDSSTRVSLASSPAAALAPRP